MRRVLACLASVGIVLLTCAGTWVLPGKGQHGGTLTNGLVAYWKLDEASGNRAGSVGFTLTDNNTVASGTGKISNAADFEEANSESLSATDGTASAVDFSGNQDFTIAVWVNIESTHATTQRSMVTKWGSSNNASYWFALHNDADDFFHFDVSGNGSSWTTLPATSFGVPSTGTWYLVVGWHDATADTLNIQVNNGTVDSTSHTTGVFNGSGAFVVGSSDAFPSELMDGLIDEVGVWNRVLTSGERTTLYNSGSGVSYPF